MHRSVIPICYAILHEKHFKTRYENKKHTIEYMGSDMYILHFLIFNQDAIESKINKIFVFFLLNNGQISLSEINTIVCWYTNHIFYNRRL